MEATKQRSEKLTKLYFTLARYDLKPQKILENYFDPLKSVMIRQYNFIQSNLLIDRFYFVPKSLKC